MDLKPIVWISSVSHLDAFSEIISQIPAWKKFLGLYEVPPGVPFIKGSPLDKVPLTYFSRGEINFQNDKMVYNSFDGQYKVLPSYFNLKDLSFTLNRSDIKSIEWYTYKNIAGYRQKNFWIKWKWIRIICNENIFDGDFLICVDNVNNTKLLYEMLNQFKEGNAISTTLKDYSNTNMIKIGYIGMILLLTPLIMNLVTKIIYGTINDHIGQAITILSLFLGFPLLLTVFIWGHENRQNIKIQYFSMLFYLTFIFSYTINMLILRI